LRARSPDAPTTTTVREEAAQSTGGRPYVRRSPGEGVVDVEAGGVAAAAVVVVAGGLDARREGAGVGVGAGAGRRWLIGDGGREGRVRA
jgi:hypothetical protein